MPRPELTKLSELAGIESLDETKLKRELYERVADVKTLLGQNTTQARQMLRKLLAGSKIEMEGLSAILFESLKISSRRSGSKDRAY